MSKKDIRAQAEQFIGYFSRLEGRRLNDAFRFWAESKDFDKETRKAIRREVDLSACGHAQAGRILKQRKQD